MHSFIVLIEDGSMLIYHAPSESIAREKVAQMTPLPFHLIRLVVRYGLVFPAVDERDQTDESEHMRLYNRVGM